MANIDVSHEDWLARRAAVNTAHFRLLWLAGGITPARTTLLQSIANALDAPYLSIGRLLSTALLDLPTSQRAASAEDSFTDILRAAHSETLALDHLDILFDRCLQLNPIELIQNVSRRFTIVAAWPGIRTSDALVYAPSDHPSHIRVPLLTLESPVHFL